MTVTIKPVAPFYDEHSGVPPPLPCTLTDQLELFGKTHTSTTLLDDEVLPTGAGALPKKLDVSARHTPDPALSRSRIPSPAPYPQARKSPGLGSRRATSRLSDNSSSDFTSDTESTASTLSELSEVSKIPKPVGEPGRPGRGGYTLETALGWNNNVYSKFKKSVHGLIDEHLDVTKCASVQKSALLKLVKDKVTDQFPDLDNYTDCWPVNDLIMMRLKYTSSRARRQEVEMAAGKSKKSKVGFQYSCIPSCITHFISFPTEMMT
ncbi:hypothetical protein EV363DRAFT_1158895 [Boletus edulis]|nr:hypothetical protein EV363DRAFT_1193019 [Boletus edulis]KAF8135410.1 hypothetical protein EV363DRAFT_1158895 [Boletus edulis]